MLLILGKSGQLAQELARKSPPDTILAGRDLIDQSQPQLVEQAILALTPSAVINAAAYTAVDRAETQRDSAFAINAHAVAAAGKACAHLDIPFVHISTDYVFSGTSSIAYKEEDAIEPINVYGASKAMGEAQLASIGGRYGIIRTSWVYSQFGTNFVKTMHRLANERDSVEVVADQLGRSTYGADLADACLFMIGLLGKNQQASGIYHFANDGIISWADLAEEVFRLNEIITGKRTQLRRITSDAFATPAKRPSWSVLDTTKIQASGLIIADWKSRLTTCFAQLQHETTTL